MPNHPDVRKAGLANGLFENRSEFQPFVQRFSRITPLMPRLRKATTASGAPLLELELEGLRKEAETDRVRKQQLVAVRYYLQGIIEECANQWWNQACGVTNYSVLIDHLRVWATSAKQEIILVSFNYDTLLELSCTAALGHQFTSMDAYHWDRWALIKPHGSTNWGRAVHKFQPLTSVEMRDYFIENPPQDNGQIEIMAGIDDDMRRGYRLFPALAIPVTSKSKFECPEEQLEELDAAISKIDRIIVSVGGPRRNISLVAGAARAHDQRA